MTYLRHSMMGTAVALAVAAMPAGAATITLVDASNTVKGTPAEIGFRIAAAYWQSILTSDVNVRLEVGYSSLGGNVLGSTGSTRVGARTADVVNQMRLTGNSAIDRQAVGSIQLTAAGGLTMITSGYDTDATKLGIDVTKKVFDDDDSANNTVLGVNSALAKALGYSINYAAGTNDRDAQITFSSDFAFDFDPTDGIQAGRYDFIGIAIHEMGHALGFVSGVDIYDYKPYVDSPNINANGSSGLFSTLDLFRYSADPTNLVPGNEPVRDLSAGGTRTWFSIDGKTQLFGNSLFSTGAYFGDGRQASHWKDSPTCGNQLGIMDPTVCPGQMDEVTALDIAAFDAMGWNVSFDALANAGYKTSSADIFRRFVGSVPEPTTWAMMLMGFAMTGASLRYRRRRLTVALAA